MKTFLLSLLMTSLATTAFAQGNLECKSLDQGPDSGYTATISANGAKALVMQETIAGPRNIAALKCEKPAVGGTRNPDEESVILVCGEPILRDDGYSLVIKNGGYSGATLATLSEVTFAGNQVIATLLCKQK
jgi:hypothetical protein